MLVSTNRRSSPTPLIRPDEESGLLNSGLGFRNNGVQTCAQAVAGTGLAGLFCGAFNAAGNAAVGALGAAILNAAGKDGYDAREGATIGAIGGAVTGFATAIGAGIAIYSCRATPTAQRNYMLGCIATNAIITAVTGYGIASAAGVSTLTAGAAIASFFVGGAVVTGAALCCTCTVFALTG